MDGDTEGRRGGLIVCNPGVIITYDPFSISGLSQHVLVITLSPPRLVHLSVTHLEGDLTLQDTVLPQTNKIEKV